MNSEKRTVKTWGAVLAVLALVATLLVGCAAAYPISSTLFYYENVTGSSGTYTYLNHEIDLSSTVILAAIDLYPEGPYKNKSSIDEVKIGKLTAQVVMYILDDNGINKTGYGINSQVPQKSWVLFEIATSAPYAEQGVGLQFTSPTGKVSTYLGSQDLSVEEFNHGLSLKIKLDDNLTEGTWKVRVYFNTEDAPGYIVPIAPPEYRYGTEYAFTVVPSGLNFDVSTLETPVGTDVKLTFSGVVGKKYILKENAHYSIEPGQEYVDGQTITISPTGTTNVFIKAVQDGTFTLQVMDGDTIENDIELTFTKSRITVELDQNEVFIGNDIGLSGTNQQGDKLYYYIEGENLLFMQIPETGLDRIQGDTTWKTTIKGSYITEIKPDEGVYRIYISNVNSNDKTQVINKAAISTFIDVNLIQPRLTITSSPSVVVQDGTLTVKGIAEGNPKEIGYYIFGSNKFSTGKVDVGKEGSFILEKTMDKNEFDAGQYYLVLQHPMYDHVFNVGPIYDGNGYIIVKNNTGSFAEPPYTVLTSINVRQSANAAQALCDAIDNNDIDDITAKSSFIIAASTNRIDPIPSQISQGTILTVSGYTNDADAGTITVEVLSTAFNPKDKYQASPSSFISVTTEPNKDGTWSVSIDTASLNIDTYTVTITDGIGNQDTSTMRIVEKTTATPTNVPATATPTPTPTTTPKSPAPMLAVIAGLAIALSMRRNL